MKYIMITRKFLNGHPCAGEKTWFVQKILHGMVTPDYKPVTDKGWPPKFHTIRKGNRIKMGETISLRVWDGKPYRSRQEEIAKVKIVATWQFRVNAKGYWLDGNKLPPEKLEALANNDGLLLQDFKDWFGKSFKGQVICWDEKIKY